MRIIGRIPKISDAEWEVMKVIWNNPKITSGEIINKLINKSAWKASTIKSLINRLLNKDVIYYEKRGKEYFYFALFHEEECRIEESQSFINKVFNGSVNSMMINFVKSQKLTTKDIDELKEILNKAAADGRRNE